MMQLLLEQYKNFGMSEELTGKAFLIVGLEFLDLMLSDPVEKIAFDKEFQEIIQLLQNRIKQ